MRLNFNVLWVDDQPEAINSQIHAISKAMYQQGFQFNPTKCQSLAEVQMLVADDVFKDEVDLILVDWDLGGGLQGQEVIAEIRQSIQYKDVVFYSSRTSALELKQYVYNVGAEGVFCASKGAIVEEILGVFEALVKKVLDLDHTRGIVMGATSDIDHMISDCLRGIHAAEDIAGKERLFAKAKGLIKETLDDLEEKAKKLDGSTDLEALLSAYDVLQAYDRLRMFNEMLKSDKYDEHDDLRKGVQGYLQGGLRNRNWLGHLVLRPDGQPEGIATTEGKVIRLEDMLTLRVSLLDLRANVRQLRDQVLPAGT